MAKEKNIKKDTEKEVEKQKTKKINIKKVLKRIGTKLATATKNLIDKAKDYVRFHKNQVVRSVTSIGILLAVVIIAVLAVNIIQGASVGNIGYPIIYQKANNDMFLLEHGAKVEDKEKVEKMQNTGSVEYSNTSNRYVLFKHGADLYLYDGKSKESKKIIPNTSFTYGFSDKDTYIYALNSSNDLYVYAYGEEAELLDNTITSIIDYSDKSIIYEKNGKLNFISYDPSKEDRTEVVSAFSAAQLSENGKNVVYTNSNKTLYRYDVKKDKHTKIASDVTTFECANKKCNKLYYTQSSEEYYLKYYTGSKSITLAKNISSVLEINEETKQVLYTLYNDAGRELYYIYDDKKPELVTKDFDYESSVIMTEKAIYYTTSKNELMYVKVSGSSLGKAKKVAKKVQGELVGFNDGVAFYKAEDDKEEATVYIASKTKATKVSNGVELGNVIISNDNDKMYFIKESKDNLGTLTMFDGKKTTKIAEKVHNFTYIKDDGIYYITDYNPTTNDGTLNRYNGKNEKIDTNVNYLIIDTPNGQKNE